MYEKCRKLVAVVNARKFVAIVILDRMKSMAASAGFCVCFRMFLFRLGFH